MEEKRFGIGQAAKMFRLSVSTLRHYEKIGLLAPEYVDPDSGYRYYSARQFECLNTIRYLRALDMPLEKIAAFLQNRSTEKMQELLMAQRDEVLRRQRELEEIARKIETRLAQLSDALSSELQEIRLKAVPEKRIAWVENACRPRSYLDLEYSIRELDRAGQEPIVFLGKVGVGISQAHLENQAFHEYDLVFLLLDPEDRFLGETELLPPSLCATVRFRGSHREAAGAYARLLAEIQKQGYRVNGFSRETTLIDEGMTNDAGQFVTELQIPVVKQEL